MLERKNGGMMYFITKKVTNFSHTLEKKSNIKERDFVFHYVINF